MTFQQIELAITAAQEGSFTRAASRLFLSQSNASNSIKSLEHELGYLIFKRTSTGLSLTPQGEHFMEHAYTIRRHIQQLKMQEDAVPAPRFHVGFESYLPCALAFSRYCAAAAPSSQSDLICYNVEHQRGIDLLASGELDILIGIAMEEYLDAIRMAVERRGLSFCPICTVPLAVLVRKGHPLAAQTLLAPEELKKYPYINYSPESEDYMLPLLEKALNMKIPYQYQIVVNMQEVRFDMVGASDAYAICAKLSRSLLDRYGLTYCSLTPLPWGLYRIIRSGEENRYEYVQYLSLLEEELRDL